MNYWQARKNGLARLEAIELDAEQTISDIKEAWKNLKNVGRIAPVVAFSGLLLAANPADITEPHRLRGGDYASISQEFESRWEVKIYIHP